MPIKVGDSRISNGTIMFVRGTENHHTYVIKIHKNFRGITYIERGYDDKTIITEVLRGYDCCPRDYATMFVFLCAHFGLEKESK